MRSLLRNPADEIVSSSEGPTWKRMLRFLPEPSRDLSDKNSSLPNKYKRSRKCQNTIFKLLIKAQGLLRHFYLQLSFALSYSFYKKLSNRQMIKICFQ
jgi:hypothetical protein